MAQILPWLPLAALGAPALLYAARVSAAGPNFCKAREIRLAFLFGGLAVGWFGVLMIRDGDALQNGLPAWAVGAFLLLIGGALVAIAALSSDTKLIREAEQMDKTTLDVVEDALVERQSRKRRSHKQD